MSVAGTPEKPNPPTRTVVSDFMSLIASCAEETILLMAGRMVVVEKKRGVRPLRRALKRNCRCIVNVLGIVKQFRRKGCGLEAEKLKVARSHSCKPQYQHGSVV
jgi:hypothetical protein